MSKQDEPITNNPLLPFLRIPPSCQSTLTLPPSLTPVETLAVGQQTTKLGVARIEEEEVKAVKPSKRNFFRTYKVLYIKEGEIRLLGLHVSSEIQLHKTAIHSIQIQAKNMIFQVSSSAPAMLLVLGLLFTTAGGRN